MKNEEFECEEVHEGFRYRGMHIAIAPDEDPLHPRRDSDNLGKLVTWHRKYALGDENRSQPDYWDWLEGVLIGLYPDLENQLEELEDEDGDIDGGELHDFLRYAADCFMVMLDVTLYDHSGLLLKEGEPSGFDEGWLGVIYVSMEDARRELGDEGDTDGDIREKAARHLRAELEEYNRYLTTGFYRYEVYDDASCDEIVDGCGSLESFDYCLEEAKRSVDSIVVSRARQTVNNAPKNVINNEDG